MKSINTKFKINNEFIQTEEQIPENKVDFYAPGNAGNQGQILQSNGEGNLPIWVDKVAEIEIDNTTITKNSQEQIQSVGLKYNEQLLTAEDIWLACSIERTV